MKVKHCNWLKISGCAFIAGLSVAQSRLPAQENEEEDIVELSPFIVTKSEFESYQATTTLAGTRINTRIKDIGAAISFFTDEFFEDTGATDADTILSYGLNTEVSGVQGNYAGGNDATDQRADPQQAQRIRGIAEASLTRGYFLTDIPFDNYNTERVTVVRGPNSLLFGIGSPGGVINNSTRAATIGDNFGEVAFRIGERQSNRATFDVNRVLIKNRLAVRLAGLREDQQYQQRPAFEIDERLHGAFQAILAKNENSEILDRTMLSGNFEDGSIHGTPPNIIPPGDGISVWFTPPDRSREEIAGVTFPDWLDDGSYRPKFTVDTRPGVNSNNLPGSFWPPYFVQFPVNFTSPTAQVASVGLPGDPEVAGAIGRIVWNQADHGRNRFDFPATVAFEDRGRVPGFTRAVIMDRNVLDYENLLITGTTTRVEHDFDVQNITFHQGFFNQKAGIELAYDQQDYYRFSSQPNDSSFGGDIRIDVSEYLSNDEPNPNVGRAFLNTWGSPSGEREVAREAFRATAFYDLDFRESDTWLRKLGRHVFTGFYSDQTIDEISRGFANNWIDAGPNTDVATILFHPLNLARRRVATMNYVSGSLLDPSIQSYEDVRLDQYITSPVPSDGDTHLISYNHLGGGGARVNPDPRNPGDPNFYDHFTVHKTLMNGSRNENNIESKAVSWQSFFFGGNLVGLLGWRNDESVEFEGIGTDRLPSGAFDPANFQLSSDPSLSTDGDTITKSLVGHFPEDLLFELPGNMDLSLHYSESENFSPQGIRRNIFGDLLPTPTGTTKEYGFTIELLNGKLSARVNRFEMANKFIDAGVNLNVVFAADTNSGSRWKDMELRGVPFEEVLQQSIDDNPDQDFSKVTSYDYVQSALRMRLPPEIESQINFRFVDPANSPAVEIDPIVGLTTIRDLVAEGTEIDIVGSITDNWRVALNVGQQETVASNNAPFAVPVLETIEANMRESQIWYLQEAPDVDQQSTLGSVLQQFVIFPLLAEKAKEGTVSQEQREWRVNFVTNYSFGEESFLRGFGVGGALRYQSKVAVGYPLIRDENDNQVPIVDSPFYGPSETNGDLWVHYSRQLTDRVHWKIQLNARNILGDNSAIPVLRNPDGATAIIRMPNTRDVFLTNTFSF